MMRFIVHAPTKGIPPIGSVLTPTMTRTYAGWSSRGQIVGQPGTQAIPVDDPAAIRHGINELASGGVFNTTVAPNVIYPPLYYLVGKQEKAPISVFSDNQLPVPAKRAPNVIVAKPYKARHGGQRQVYQPQVVQTWRGMKGTSNG